MNQYYSEELSQKAKRGMRETRMKGKFTGGRVNYGYSCHEQKLSVIDEEAAVLLEIFTDYANGKSLTDIANDLNARGITNRGKPFLMNSIYFLLNNEKYTGVYRFGDKVFTETYPQIIPVDLYETVKTKLDANRPLLRMPFPSQNHRLQIQGCYKRNTGTACRRSRYRRGER